VNKHLKRKGRGRGSEPASGEGADQVMKRMASRVLTWRSRRSVSTPLWRRPRDRRTPSFEVPALPAPSLLAALSRRIPSGNVRAPWWAGDRGAIAEHGRIGHAQ
jgi:hypothetical protein